MSDDKVVPGLTSCIFYNIRNSPNPLTFALTMILDQKDSGTMLEFPERDCVS